MHTNRSEGFSVCTPPGWSLEDTTYSYSLFDMDVFALARNRPAIGITPSHSYPDFRPLSNIQWTAAMADSVPPGGAIVMFWHFHGGPLILCNFSRDTIGESLATAVDTLHMNFSRPEPFRFGFEKWGDNWQVTILARHVSRQDSLAIRDLLRSIVFQPLPVTLNGQAAQLAYRALPPEVRGNGNEDASGLAVSVTENAGAFQVLFRPCFCCGCDNKANLPEDAEWLYRVSAEGLVEAVGP
jgi:hypothetical protein